MTKPKRKPKRNPGMATLDPKFKGWGVSASKKPRAGRKHRIPKCQRCKNVMTVALSSRYDAYYCNACNKWIEPTCDDPRCFFCADRPAKPFPSRA